MTVDSLYKLYNDNIKGILNKDMLSAIADRSINIDGLGFINRVLIYIQNKNATFVRDDVSWDIAGRKLIDNAHKIYTIDPKYKTKYIDSATNEQLKSVDLSPIEFENAVRYGIIKKEKEMTGLRVVVMYNIKDTKVDDVYDYKEYMDKCRYNLRISDLLEFITSSLNVACQSCEGDSHYDIEYDTLYIGSDDFENKIKAISDCLNYHFDSGYEYTTNDTDTEYIRTICNNLTFESIMSMTSDYYINEDAFENISKISDDAIDTLLNRLNTQYDSIDAIIRAIKPRECLVDNQMVKKASEVVDIVNAYKQFIKLRG